MGSIIAWGLVAAFAIGILFYLVAKSGDKNPNKWFAIGFFATIAATIAVIFVKKSKENKK